MLQSWPKAEVRDRLAQRVNVHYQQPVLNVRVISDIRQESRVDQTVRQLLGTVVKWDSCRIPFVRV